MFGWWYWFCGVRLLVVLVGFWLCVKVKVVLVGMFGSGVRGW